MIVIVIVIESVLGTQNQVFGTSAKNGKDQVEQGQTSEFFFQFVAYSFDDFSKFLK